MEKKDKKISSSSSSSSLSTSKEPKKGLQEILEPFFRAAIHSSIDLCKNKKINENSIIKVVETNDFNVLPEGCIYKILSFTTPRDACRFSVLSTVFKSAAESDELWEIFMPSHYEEIIASSLSSSLKMVNFSSKKERYFHLCDNPVFIDDGNKRFTLDRRSGKRCIMVGIRSLWATWQSTSEFWTFKADPSSRFAEVAELLDVRWLEIKGSLETRLLSPNTLYAAYIVFKFQEDHCGFDPASRGDVEVKLVGGGDNSLASGWRSFYFEWNAERMRRQLPVQPNDGQYPQERGDGWMEIEMGHFFNDIGEDAREVQICLTHLSSDWKRGLVVQGMEFRPIVNN